MAKSKHQEAGSEAQTDATDLDQVALEGESLEEAIGKLTPEQTELFMRALTLTMRKRRLMLVGNLVALLLLVIGLLFAFVAYANRSPGAFTGWVFLVPFGSAGFSLWFFGFLAKRAGQKTHETLVIPSTDTASNS